MKAADSIRLWQRVSEVYMRHLRESTAATECLRALNITDRLLLEHFQAGYSDGTLPNLLSTTGELQESLRVKGLLNSGGEETLSGCLVLPILAAGAAINGFCGVKPCTGSRPEQIVVPGAVEGLIRGALVKVGSRLFVTNRVLDAFALWLAGFRNVVMLPAAPAGVPELERLISDYGYREIYLCTSDDSPEKLAAEQVRQVLLQRGTVSAAIVQWPPGTNDAQQFFLTHKADDFKALLPKPAPQAGITTNAPPPSITETPDGMNACFEGRHYELRAIQKPGPSRLRATVRALGEQGRFVVETVDFYYSRSRRGFMSESARLFHQTLDVVEGDVSRMTDELERYVQRHAPDGQSRLRTVDESERAEGIRLGRAADLVGEIVRDIGSLGTIGEETN